MADVGLVRVLTMVINTTFALGKLVSTPSALAVLTPDDIQTALRRHAVGDWGEVGAEDWETNDESVRSGGRLLSVYTLSTIQFWIITEWDRSATTVILPSDY